MSAVEEIIEAVYLLPTVTLVNGIKRQIDAEKDPHECATMICDYLGIARRENRSNIKKILIKHINNNHEASQERRQASAKTGEDLSQARVISRRWS